jgi:hypothetical protein
MRNPHFIEVRLENDGIFANSNDKQHIIVKEFDIHGD